jgi:hypothetical protein
MGFFEIYGVYNDTISGFQKFIEDSRSLGHNYMFNDITVYEQNIEERPQQLQFLTLMKLLTSDQL